VCLGYKQYLSLLPWATNDCSEYLQAPEPDRCLTFSTALSPDCMLGRLFQLVLSATTARSQAFFSAKNLLKNRMVESSKHESKPIRFTFMGLKSELFPEWFILRSK